jgi:hypothetical protein
MMSVVKGCPVFGRDWHGGGDEFVLNGERRWDYFKTFGASVFPSYRMGRVATIVIDGVCANYLVSEKQNQIVRERLGVSARFVRPSAGLGLQTDLRNLLLL